MYLLRVWIWNSKMAEHNLNGILLFYYVKINYLLQRTLF